MTSLRAETTTGRLSPTVFVALTLVMIPVVIPFSSGAYGTNLEIPITDFGLALGAMASLPRINAARQYGKLLLPATWGLVALVLVTFTESPTVGYHGLAAWVFAFRAFSAVVIGAGLAVSGVRAERVLVQLAAVGAVVAIIVALDVALSSENHLVWGEWDLYGTTSRGLFLNGSFAGLPLWGRFGVNALADYYAVVFALCLAGAMWTMTRPSRRRRWLLVLMVAGLGASGWLVVTSGARQALVVILAVATFGLFVRFRAFASQVADSPELRRRAIRWARTGAVTLTLGALLVAGPASAPVSSLRKAVERSSTGGFTELTSRRPDLFRPAFESIRERPVTGTGFYGAFVGDSDAPTRNIHNAYLAAVYKMGLIGAALLVFAFWQLGRPVVRNVFRALRNGTPLPHLDVMDVALIVFVVLVGLVTDIVVLTPVMVPLLLLYSLRYSAHYDESPAAQPSPP